MEMSSPYSAWGDANDSCKPSLSCIYKFSSQSSHVSTLRKVGISLSSSCSCGSCSFVFDSLHLSLFQFYLLFGVSFLNCFVVLAQKTEKPTNKTPALPLKERRDSFFFSGAFLWDHSLGKQIQVL